MDPVVVRDLGQELAHLFRVGSRRGGVEPPLGVLARLTLFVLVATVVRKWATVVACCVELGPTDDAKASDARNVGQQACRLCPEQLQLR